MKTILSILSLVIITSFAFTVNKQIDNNYKFNKHKIVQTETDTVYFYLNTNLSLEDNSLRRHFNLLPYGTNGCYFKTTKDLGNTISINQTKNNLLITKLK